MSGVYALTAAPTCDFPHGRPDNLSQHPRIFRTVLGPKHHATRRVPVTQKLNGDEMMRMSSQVVMRSPQCYSLLLKPTLAVPNIGLPR
jgi:hypothetical protein